MTDANGNSILVYTKSGADAAIATAFAAVTSGSFLNEDISAIGITSETVIWSGAVTPVSASSKIDFLFASELEILGGATGNKAAKLRLYDNLTGAGTALKENGIGIENTGTNTARGAGVILDTFASTNATMNFSITLEELGTGATASLTSGKVLIREVF